MQGIYDRENGSLNFNSRNEKFNVFGNYNASSRKNFNDIFIKRRFRKDGEIASIFDQSSWIKSSETGNTLKAGIDYFINQSNTIGLVVNGSYNPENRVGTNYTGIYDSNQNLSSAVNTTNNNEVMFENYSANLNYESKLDTTGTKLNIDADFARFATQNKGHYFYTDYDSLSIPISLTSIKNNTSSNINRIGRAHV